MQLERPIHRLMRERANRPPVDVTLLPRRRTEAWNPQPPSAELLARWREERAEREGAPFVPAQHAPAQSSLRRPDPGWGDPLDLLAGHDAAGAPVLRGDHLPPVLAGFAFDVARRIGADPAAAALCCIVAAAAATHDDWTVQVRQHDHSWRESARLWGAIVAPPASAKSPLIRAATTPFDLLDAQARHEHGEAMATWRRQVASLKAAKVATEAFPPAPKLNRFLIEGSTTEAIGEALRDDPDAKQSAPLRKVLIRADELGELVAGLDAYRPGGRGGADRGVYLRLFGGGRHIIDRIGRGSFAASNWSACLLGGIQPEPIQRIARDAADDGLIQRFLFCVPGPHPAGEDRRPDDEALGRYAAMFPVLARLRPVAAFPGAVPRPVTMTEAGHAHREAMELLFRAHAAMPDTTGRFQAALAKMPAIFARLTLTLHLVQIADALAQGMHVEDPHLVPSETVAMAAAYARDILLPHLLRADRLLFETRQAGHAAWIAGFILASPACRASSRVAARDIQRAYGPLRPPEARRELEQVMAGLETAGWCRAEAPDNPVRPIAGWTLNPALFSRFADRAAAERERRDRVQQDTAAAIQAAMKGRT